LPDDDGEARELVVATLDATPSERVRDALQGAFGDVQAETLIALRPLFWTRVRLGTPCARGDLAAALLRAGIRVRYVASARRQSMQVPPAFDATARPFEPVDWAAAPDRTPPVDPRSEGRWFLREQGGGLAVDRALCGTGRGTRLAVIDDDAADFDLVDLDRTVLVGLDRASSASGHGAMMAGWAVGARTYEGARFAGVAPGASVRAYLIPRPTDDVVPLALAIARAAIDGADVIVCATFVDAMMSPMLDDALEVATRLGRRGRGCAVVFPTGREASSPMRSIHASLSLSLGDPACDPRIFCVAPGARAGGWFLWREQHGKLRPFSNRGPAVRLLAPGDDVAYPFLDAERMFHAESSGASALAAGVLLLVLSSNPSLYVEELFDVLQRCATPPDPLSPETVASFVDRADSLPLGPDTDGHDAKQGYGRLHAFHSCTAASDPISLELLAMGEREAARAWAAIRREQGKSAYSSTLACWAVRALLADASAEHALRVILRHLRLVATDARRHKAHPRGAVVRQLVLLVRALANGSRVDVRASAELQRLQEALERAQDDAGPLEQALVALAGQIFAPEDARRDEPLAEQERRPVFASS
jgi:hypothetical protein